jgi:Carboxypeptidase regulatory-like domain
MKPFLTLVLLCACAATAPAQAPGSPETPLSVGYRKQARLPISGATAAYSLDSSIAEASVSSGAVEISGKGPGSTNVVVVTSAGVQTIAVIVPMPPPVLPPGFEPPERQDAGETGSYEFRYNSGPAQITNSLELKRMQGKSFTRMQVVNANLFSAGSSASAVGFPFLAYQISRPETDITFADKSVAASPLTVDGYLVRGFHLRQGPWQFHGGFTSIATFQGLFLATDREYTAGISRLFRLDDVNSLEANAYYFQNPENQRQIAANGAAGSLVYRRKLSGKGSFLTELGVSHGFGFATRGNYDDERNHLIGNFRIQSRNFASLAVNNQRGTFADLNAGRALTERLYAGLDLNQSNYNLPTLSQKTFTGSGLLNFKLNRSFSINGGGAYAAFQSQVPAGQRISAVNLPAGLDYSSRHFGGGFQYQRTLNMEGGGGGNDFAFNARASAGRFQVSGFFRHDVQVPTLAAIFSQVPGLQDALDRAGIVASSPEQLAGLLRNTAILELLGFTNAFTVDLAPARNDLSAALSWISQHPNRRKIDLSYFTSNTELVRGHFILTTATFSYSQRLRSSNDIVGSASLVRAGNNGVITTRALFSISLQHRFFTVPGLLLPGRHGVIEGHIFRDDDSTGRYQAQLPAIAGVEVRLDGDRAARTDAHGHYLFHHVPFGVHHVEARFDSGEPFFYTTDSPATADMNATVDFGINFAKGQIYGYLLNDAGTGIGGITVELANEKVTRRAMTGENGKFAFTGLAPGGYSVATLPDSYPSGYALQDLAAQTITVESGKPAAAQFKVRALRSIAGKVVVYDKSTLQTVPLAGVTVRLKKQPPEFSAGLSPETAKGLPPEAAKLPEAARELPLEAKDLSREAKGLSLEAKTGPNGAYIFRNLPAGTYILALENDGKAITRAVTLPPEPANLRDVDLNAGTREAPSPKQ